MASEIISAFGAECEQKKARQGEVDVVAAEDASAVTPEIRITHSLELRVCTRDSCNTCVHSGNDAGHSATAWSRSSPRLDAPLTYSTGPPRCDKKLTAISRFSDTPRHTQSLFFFSVAGRNRDHGKRRDRAMGRTLMRGAVVFGFLVVGMQLVPTAVRSKAVTASGPHTVESIDQRVGSILDRSCQDCHSDHTHWPWYGRVAPVSWLLARDVSQGRQKLDFSQWAGRSVSANERMEICGALSDGRMPPRAYTILHRNAELSERDVDLICAWAAAALVHEPSLKVSGARVAAAAPIGAATGSSLDRQYPVTAVRGPSWLKHLGLKISQTHMGGMGGTQAAPSSPRHEPEVDGVNPSPTNEVHSAEHHFMTDPASTTQQDLRILNRPFVLAGADLYRLSCQSCHGPEGKGAPPEISSLIGPVQGTSPLFVKKRMGARGGPIDDELASQLAGQAEAALRNQLENGSEKMPSFRNLREDEIEALIGYLQKLAGVASPKNSNLLVRESAARVGEHVVKGTCHICHASASLSVAHSLSSVERQVQHGSSPMTRMMTMMGGDAMPAYPYFTEEEIAAAYYYLVEYPPQP